MNLGVLFSGGKDSTFAMHELAKTNEIACLISISSENEYSYMFHTPNIHLTELQAEALQIPLLNEKTTGEKEKELEDLKRAIKKAIEIYKIEGVITGALFSEYQADRIQTICNELKIKCFNPIWHLNQYEHFKKVLQSGFKVMFNSVAALGFDKTWIGREINLDDLEKLKKLNEKYGINIAGEGGEFESLVLDAPMFKKKLQIKEFEIISESDINHKMIVKKAELIEK